MTFVCEYKFFQQNTLNILTPKHLIIFFQANRTTEAKAFAAMSQENEETIAAYKDKVMIVKTPKKGGLGLNDSLKNICRVAAAMAADSGDLEKLKAEVCF